MRLEEISTSYPNSSKFEPSEADIDELKETDWLESISKTETFPAPALPTCVRTNLLEPKNLSIFQSQKFQSHRLADRLFLK